LQKLLNQLASAISKATSLNKVDGARPSPKLAISEKTKQKPKAVEYRTETQAMCSLYNLLFVNG